MLYRNTKSGYGLIAQILHWVMALSIFAMFGLGYWIRTLTYTSPYYQSAPNMHQSIGLVLLLLLVIRFGWKMVNINPATDDLSRVEDIGSSAMHWVLYALLFAVMVVGYLIATLDGRAIPFFDLVDIPSLYTDRGLEKLAGLLHWVLAYAIIALAGLHGLAALWHHFIKRDRVLLRMIAPLKNTDK
ncbi:MAG: cytochrome B [Rhodobacteraceae bacterium]|nr:MAG: cytochrome B [Paracoccaceae bacterium]